MSRGRLLHPHPLAALGLGRHRVRRLVPIRRLPEELRPLRVLRPPHPRPALQLSRTSRTSRQSTTRQSITGAPPEPCPTRCSPSTPISSPLRSRPLRPRHHGQGAAPRQGEDPPLAAAHPRRVRRAQLSFLRDTAENLAAVCAQGRAAGLICYTPIGDEAALRRPAPARLLPHPAARRRLRRAPAPRRRRTSSPAASPPSASSTPTRPPSPRRLRAGRRQLSRPGDRIVLGPSPRRRLLPHRPQAPPPRALRQHRPGAPPPSPPRPATAAHAANLELIELPLWYDVDDAATLATPRRRTPRRPPPTLRHLRRLPRPAHPRLPSARSQDRCSHE